MKEISEMFVVLHSVVVLQNALVQHNEVTQIRLIRRPPLGVSKYIMVVRNPAGGLMLLLLENAVVS